MRIYNRALSGSGVKALYHLEKVNESCLTLQ